MSHPAKFSPSILYELERLALGFYVTHDIDGLTVLDPFAGEGGIHELRKATWATVRTWGIEIEPEWAGQSQYTLLGDATALPFDDSTFNTVMTSPCYGNRMADHHEAKDGSYRRTYTHALGRTLHSNNAGKMQWGTPYKVLHERAWKEVYRVLEDDGMFVLNVKDHRRDFKRMHVGYWHLKTCQKIGFTLMRSIRVETKGFRYGENTEVRYPERLLIFRKFQQNI